MNSLLPLTAIICFAAACVPPQPNTGETPSVLRLSVNEEQGTISVLRRDGEVVVTQHSRTGVRPYIHPIMAPDGKGKLTEYSPSHHKHQTGLYWGLKRVNGRDYFMNWQEDYWKKISAGAVDKTAVRVKWQTLYHLLDEQGNAILAETQTWSFEERKGKFIMDLVWNGEALADVTMGKFYVGGLFLRMPWHEGIRGEVISATGRRNGEAEGQRAIWNDIGIEVEGRDDLAHIAILDHPENPDFPVAWRVDNELGVGPSRQILGDWTIRKGNAVSFRYRLLVYTGDFDRTKVNEAWKEFVCE